MSVKQLTPTDMSGNGLTGLPTPVAASDATTKAYVDNKVVGGGASYFPYVFSNSTAAPPATGTIRYNNATPASVTTLWVHYMTSDTTDTKTRLLLRQSGDKLYIQDKDVSTTYHIFRLTAAPTDVTTYATLTVVYDSGAGTFGNNQTLLAGFLSNTIPDGDKGDVTTSNGGATWVIDVNAATNTKLADMATATFKGRTTAGTGDPEDLTATQATALLNTFGTTTKGLVPSPGTAAGNFLKDDGTWAAASGGGVSGTKLSALTALGAGAATADLVEIVDVSDTTMAASGTNKKLTLAELVTFLNANGITIVAASETVSGKVELATAAETLTGTDNTRAVHTAGLAPLVSGGGPLFGFLFDTTTTTGTSTNGLRLNNATPASATIVYVNYTCREGVDLKTRLLAGTAGDRLYIQDRGNSGAYRIYELTAAPTDVTTYASVPVVHRGGAGSLWASGLSIVAGFTAPPITVGTSAPASPLTNDIWLDTT